METQYTDSPDTDPPESRSNLSLLGRLTAEAPVAIYHADEAGRLTYANALYRLFFGLAPGQGLHEWTHAVHPLDRAKMRYAWDAFCKCPQATQFRWRLQTSTGKVRFVNESVSPLGAMNGGGFVGVITDVTDYEQAQIQLTELQNRATSETTGQGQRNAELYRRLPESELISAIQNRQLELHYQPKVDIASNLITGAEALIRWRHPERGLISPLDFIPLAEVCGLIGAIGEWVIQQACRQVRAWQLEGLPVVRIAVNLSPAQFRHGSLLEIIGGALESQGLEPQLLEVELTESTVMSDAEGSVLILEQLSKMGVVVSVDDFGTGYSSMSYLKRFPVDKLKIDRSFIKDLAGQNDDALIVKAIITLAHSLRLKVVAEGVETAEQLEMLKSLACDQYQGFLYSPAVTPEDFGSMLRHADAARLSFMDGYAMRTHSKLSAYRK